MVGEKIIDLRNVYKVYQMGKEEVVALNGVSMHIHANEKTVIIGPSGSGKSTLMHIIGTLDRPTKGKVYFMGRDIATLSDSELAILRGKTIGFVFQTFNLIPSLTALENVELPMIFQGVPSIKSHKRAAEVLKQVGLGHRMTHLPNELSGGERQRVAIARALVNDPKIILADEPTGNLDSKTGKEIMELLFHLSEKEKKTLIIVTHDVELAKKIDAKIRIKDGKIASEEEFR